FAGDVLYVAQIELAATKAGRADADERNVAGEDGSDGIVGGVQAAGLVGLGDQVVHAGLDNRRAAGVQHFNFGLADVHAGNFVSHVREASRAHRTDVSETEKTDGQAHCRTPWIREQVRSRPTQ